MPYDATDFVVTEVPAPVLDPRSITDPRERVAYLRDFLRGLPPERFDMGDWSCGTAVCIGGWTDALFVGNTDSTTAEQTGQLLGLGPHTAYALFFPFGARLSDGSLAIELRDPRRAANVLDHYLQTGKICWEVA